MQILLEEPDYPFHDFWLLSLKEHPEGEYQNVLDKDAPIRIPDALLWYFYDTFLWIPTYNPASKQNYKGQGLNMYGPTIIKWEGAEIFGRICAAWAALFEQGPSEIILSAGMITIFEEDETSTEKLHKLKVSRDYLVRTFQTLDQYSHQSLKGKGSYILHIGV